MKTIKDAIHGNVILEDHEVAILDSPEMQRLRGIKQLGFTYLVYPSATHTRFEHSLGTFYLADLISKQLGLKKSESDKVKLAALLHDIGHGPFSHSTEDALKLYNSELAKHEEHTSRMIKESAISDILKKSGFKPAEIADIANGKTVLGQIVSGEIDVDRMDYLMRDSYYTGAAYGVIDVERLVQTMHVHKGNLVIKEDGRSAAEALVLARYLMYPTIYQHHTSRIIHSMYSYAISECFENRTFDAEQLYEMDDIGIVSKMRGLDTFPAGLMKRIERRDLYKRTAVFYKQDFESFEKIINIKPEKLKQLQIEITETADLKNGEVLIDIPKKFFSVEAKAHILADGQVKELKEVSPLAKSLLDAQWSYWYLGVYTDKKNSKKVEKAAEDVLLGF